jgi:hypothetical protein
VLPLRSTKADAVDPRQVARASKITTALANPTHYFEMTVDVVPGVQYALWMRGRAQNDFWGNDSVFIQFSDAANDAGPMWRIPRDVSSYR